jgi:ubiquinone/menaquinone biosynthesis C-methylase UbiE
MIRSGPPAIRAYYKHRASEYDGIYEIANYRADLGWLRAWLARHVKGKSVLEVAAGTGYWTEVCSRSARRVVATDYNAETLTIAARRRLGPKVALVAADAFLLPAFKIKFDVGVACLWWSHLKRQEQQKFLAHFFSRLAPGAKLLLIDEAYRKEMTNSISRHDRFGNRYELRITTDNVIYEIVKNFPDDSGLRQSLSNLSNRVRVRRLKHFWAVSARAKTLQ